MKIEDSLPAELQKFLQVRTDASNGTLSTTLVNSSIEWANSTGNSTDLALAASFDLLVSSKFYRTVVPENWLWCEKSGYDFYPHQNTCPSCALEGVFVYHKGHKPGSGQIGPATAEALRELLAAYFAAVGRNQISIYSGAEPVDLAIVDFSTENIFLAEVKASPLFVIPIAIRHKDQTFKTTNAVPLKHSTGTVRRIHEVEVVLFFPNTIGKPVYSKLPLIGMDADNWFETALAMAIKTKVFNLEDYFETWVSMWISYKTKDTKNPLFWFTGACGLPRNPGEGWPKSSKGKPEGSISDSKTSVGMDRTDDIKKSTFQVLHLGVATRKIPIKNWKLKIGVASNLHAARHFDHYLKPYQDIIWSWDDQQNGREGIQNWYNLFDGIITFSKSHTVDSWLSELVTWHGGKENETKK